MSAGRREAAGRTPRQGQTRSGEDSRLAHRLATLEQDGWRLESGEDRHRANPESFWIPPARAREQLPPGGVVQLIFVIQTEDAAGALEQSAERMWVYVTGRVGALYMGRLQSQPECTDALRPGTPVVFGPEHVIGIADPPPAGWQPA